MEKDKADQMMQTWYDWDTPLYEMIFSGELQQRELAALLPKMWRSEKDRIGIRHMRATAVNGIRYLKKSFMKDQSYNLYHGIVKYVDGVPKMSTVLSYRSEDEQKWKEKAHTQIISCDCFLDVDSPTHSKEHMEMAKQDTLAICEHLNENKIPFALVFSGEGYHVRIYHKVFEHLNLNFDKNSVSDDNAYVLFNQISKHYHDNYSEFVDLDLHDSMRLIKLPYSITFYPQGVYVVWPFSSMKEFKLHTPDDYRLNIPYKQFKGYQNIYRRGIPIINNSWTPKNTDAWLKKIKVKI